MYAIKMDNNKELITTVRGMIYQNEKRADTLVFLIPRSIEERDLADCSLLLRYVLPSGSGRSEEIEMDPEPYNEDYYRYRLKLSTRFTSEYGIVKLCPLLFYALRHTMKYDKHTVCEVFVHHFQSLMVAKSSLANRLSYFS